MSTRFNESWRAACLEVLQLRRSEIYSQGASREPSWQAVRDEIMVERDAALDGEGSRKDSALTRQDLANFEKGMRLNDVKFEFVDAYVRRLIKSGQSDQALQRIKEFNARRDLDTLASMYTASLNQPDIVVSDLKSVRRLTYVREFDGGTFGGLFVAIDLITEAGVGLTLGYCPRPLDQMTVDDAHEVVFYAAYLIPLSFDEQMASIMEAMNEGRAANQGFGARQLNCVVKAFRPEFRGLPNLGYADGEARITRFLLQSPSEDDQALWSSVTLDYPNPLVSPSLQGGNDPARYQKANVSQVKDIIPSENIEEGMTTSTEGDWHDTETWRVELSNDGTYDKLIEEILRVSYKGYLF